MVQLAREAPALLVMFRVDARQQASQLFDAKLLRIRSRWRSAIVLEHRQPQAVFCILPREPAGGLLPYRSSALRASEASATGQ
jgi:hypothetical protein